MKKLPCYAAVLSLAALALVPEGHAASYQFIAPDGSGNLIWGTDGIQNDAYWNQNAPWNGTPSGESPTSGDTLNLAAGVSLYLRTGPSGTYRTYSVDQLSAGAAAGNNLQVIRGNSSTRANLEAGTIAVSDGASLSIQRGHNNARILATATNASIGTGSTFYLGGDIASSSISNALDGFVVSGTTTVNGTLSAHFQNRDAIGDFNLGDLIVNTSGTVYLADNISVGPSGSTALHYQARSLFGSGKIYAISDNAADNGHQVTAELEIKTVGSSNEDFSGTMSDALVAQANKVKVLALTLSGTGRQTLSGANTYTGATTLSGGTLILSGAGSINETSGIAIEGGELIQNSSTALAAPITWTEGGIGGTGTISGDLAASGLEAKFLNPGDTVGTLTVTGDLLLSSSTTVQFGLNGISAGTDYNVLQVGSMFTLDNATLDLSVGYAASVNDQFTIAQFDSLDGTFNGLADGGSFAVDTYTFEINYNANDITLRVIAIPEPGSVALLGFSLIVLGGTILRRKHLR